MLRKGFLNFLTLNECHTFVQLTVKIIVHLSPFCRINGTLLRLNRKKYLGSVWRVVGRKLLYKPSLSSHFAKNSDAALCALLTLFVSSLAW